MDERGSAVVRVLLAVGLMFTPGRAHAQGFDVQLLRPTPDLTDPYFVSGSASLRSAGTYSAGIFIDFAKNPLVLYGSDGSRLAALVDRQVTAHFLGSYAFTEHLSIGVAVPVVLDQSGEGPSGIPSAADAGSGLGDVRIVPRYVLFATSNSPLAPQGFAIATEVDIFIPTGSRADFQGEGFRVEPKVTAELVLPSALHVDAGLGYAVRPEAKILNLDIDDMLAWSVGTAYPLTERFSASAELHGAASVLAPDIGSEEVPLELLVGGKHRTLPFLTLKGGAGFGIINGAGAPDWRVFVAVALHSPPAEPNADRDGDGIRDSDDACPDAPEDKDGFEDANGCPDPDNDGDGILDTADRCPQDPEDKDSFEDEDGCPDPDNDQDGILDTTDKCPQDPEDKDSFEDEDGCPDPDNDRDGILDAADKCPQDPEDKDGFEDEDGCPDPDNDQDGILDTTDKCPLAPETLNGFEDEDGCPDKGGKVLVTCAKIEINEKVYFDSALASIQPRSFPLLDEVAAVLVKAKNIRRLRVEGHTDSRASDDYNMRLSQDRASSVRAYLIAHGVEESRLEAQGFGETRPIASNNTERGREQNRRVEFFIVDQDENAKCAEAPRNATP